MRKDMKKKLVDTHRVGSAWTASKGKKRKNPDVLEARRERIEVEEYEDWEGVTIELSESVRHSSRSGYRYRNTYDRKQFGENLNPLWRYLNSQIGRNWDTVYSEICENMDRRSAVGGHIFEHLGSYVTLAKEVHIVDGVPHRANRYFGDLEPITHSGRIGQWGSFYVDPRDNKLKRGGPLVETARQKEARERREDREDRLRHITGDLWMSRHPETDLWYCITAIPQEYRYEEVQKWDFVRVGGQ
ncbi:MAG: hypothetical protein EB075_11710, partial [Bacteroidetes bacterium]|nr:hypothetical protein [Bacteroidota bacterium]